MPWDARRQSKPSAALNHATRFSTATLNKNDQILGFDSVFKIIDFATLKTYNDKITRIRARDE